ncbi:hypothetical protein OIU85_001770 [Salix viminalis]|uniref:RRM domain-containing protein n=1 Tax=Salix viminalis TaxID=40686 RepID=A0A9Q0ZYB8_SALVM|nr:hypothetical protein OIU85_001770 [Salix viminalis]
MEGDDVDMVAAETNESVPELDDMKKRLKEMEDEAAALLEMQAKVEKEMGSVQDPSASTAASQANREEVDSRSVFVGNKVYLDGMPRAWMEEHVKEHLEKLGRIVKVQLAHHTPSSIRTNYCYVTFETHEAAVACVNGVNVDGLNSGNRKVNARAALAKPRVRITSEETEQASSSETGQGNEVQQDSHRSGTDAPSGIDRSKRSERRNAEPQSVGKKKQFTSPEILNTGRPACMSSLNHFTSPERLKTAPSQGISRAAAHGPSRHNERKTKQQIHSCSKRPHSSMEEVCPRSTETFVQRSRAHVDDHENSSRRNSQRKEHSSRTGYGDKAVITITLLVLKVVILPWRKSYSQSSFRKDHSSRTGFVEGASSSVRNSHGLSDTRTSAVVSRGCKVDRGDDQRMPSRNGKDYKSRDHPRAASNDAHEESHSSDNHRSRVKDSGSRSRGGSSRKYHRGRVAQHHQGRSVEKISLLGLYLHVLYA